MRTILVATVLLPALSASAAAHEPVPAAPGITLSAGDGTNRRACSQFVFGAEVPAERVRPLVPERFVFSRDVAGKAVLGYRVLSCARASVDGDRPRRITWSELGVRILPPAGLPEIHADAHVDGHDYYGLAFRTSDAALAQAVESLGIGRAPGSLEYQATRTLKPGLPAITADVTGAARFSSRERDGGTVTVSGRSAIGQWHRFTPEAHDRNWYVSARDCGLVSGLTARTRLTGTAAPMKLSAQPGSALAALLGRTEASSTTDPYLEFDTEIRWEAAGEPVALAPAAYAVLRGRSQGTPLDCIPAAP